MTVFLFHPIFCILGSFILIFQPYIQLRQTERHEKIIMHSIFREEIKDFMTVLDKHAKSMPDVVYVDLCNAIQSVYRASEHI